MWACTSGKKEKRRRGRHHHVQASMSSPASTEHLDMTHSPSIMSSSALFGATLWNQQSVYSASYGAIFVLRLRKISFFSSTRNAKRHLRSKCTHAWEQMYSACRHCRCSCSSFFCLQVASLQPTPVGGTQSRCPLVVLTRIAFFFLPVQILERGKKC